MRNIFFPFVIITLLFSSCAVFKSQDSRAAHKIKREVAHSPIFSKAFTGFTLLDPATGKTLADFNGDHYFTPASNTKIFTLATCLEVLGDSVPRLKYSYGEDTSEPSGIFFVVGTGDPTFLHPDFQAWQHKPSFFEEHPYATQFFSQLRGFSKQPRWGRGWAWDDFLENYSCEISSMPVFGNSIPTTWLKKLTDRPISSRDSTLEILESRLIHRMPLSPKIRSWKVDHFEAHPVLIPMFNADQISPQFVNDSLGLSLIDIRHEEGTEAIGGDGMFSWNVTPVDTVLRRMMHQSDNFIAEQMLLVCAGVKFGLLQQDTLIKWMLDSTLSRLPQRPKWVDGSGLSRYNLMTPQSIAQVLLKLWKEQPKERPFTLFPAGGVSGTIADWYVGKNGKPYVFAKTGSMGGVHCLSGFLVCESGKVLIFSFMHNNFVGSNRAWKMEMQRILEQIHEQY